MRLEIEDMKKEALRRMEALETKLHEAEQSSNAAVARTKKHKVEDPTKEAVTAMIEHVREVPKKSRHVEIQDLEPTAEKKETTTRTAGNAAEKAAAKAPAAETPARDPQADRRLHGTWWKIMLNIGREPSTWMPKTWGASGERLLMNLELEFTADTLHEREDFLNGPGKVLSVKDFVLGPTMTENSHRVKVKETGGWRVAPGEGPLGTDLLRFYIELEEEARHQGSDVYCPKGRVYMTCGFFQCNKDHMSTDHKDSLAKKQRLLNEQYEQANRDMEEANLWDKIKLGKDLMDLRMQIEKVSTELNRIKVIEPEKQQLRFSPRGDVALTKEGGLCCRVAKGLAVEYHILGKFGVAAAPHHDDEDNGTDGDRLKP
jgi:hypothetical protein